MGGSKREDRLLVAVGDRDELLGVFGIDAGDALNDEVFPSNSPGLVETTDIDLACERNSERFGAENGCERGTTRCRSEPRDDVSLTCGTDRMRNVPNLLSATNDALTASVNSIGNSGGTTEVKTSTTSNNNFPLSISFFLPSIHTYAEAAMAKIKRKPIKTNDSRLLADMRSSEKIMVRTS